MTLRRTTGNFDGQQQFSGYAQGHNLCVSDNLQPGSFGGSATCFWTAGASVSNAVNLLTPLPDKATILSYSASARLARHQQEAGAYYGKLGKIITALYFGTPGTDPFFGSVAVPQNASLMATLWDPAVDDLPPLDTNSAGVLLPASVVYPLPEPLPIVEQAIAIGIWMLPSLVPSVSSGLVARQELDVYDATYEVYYDDGR